MAIKTDKCLSAASFCPPAKCLPGAGNPRSGPDDGVPFLAYFFPARKRSRASSGEQPPELAWFKLDESSGRNKLRPYEKTWVIVGADGNQKNEGIGPDPFGRDGALNRPPPDQNGRSKRRPYTKVLSLQRLPRMPGNGAADTQGGGGGR